MSRLATCTTCGGQMDKGAPFCPHCGRDYRTGMMVKGNSFLAQGCNAGCWIIVGLIAFFIVAMIVGSRAGR